MAKLKFLTDWRFILIYVGLAGGLAALVLTGGGGMSPIDRYMNAKGGGGGIKAIFSGGGGGGSFGEAPEGSYELIGNKAGTQFAWVDPQYLTDRTALRAIGAAVCKDAGADAYCEVYFWTDKSDIKVELPVARGGSLAVLYKIKDGKADVKMMQAQ